jgi:hypothetical protein
MAREAGSRGQEETTVRIAALTDPDDDDEVPLIRMEVRGLPLDQEITADHEPLERPSRR